MKKRVVVVGGGTGTYTALMGLKKYPQLDLSVIVSMMDDGGSNRVIRDEFGLLPTSDLRQCMVALASEDSDQTLRKLFTYRYSAGTGISGMTFGNLFMAALTDIYKGDQDKAIEETCEILGVKGEIIPVTFDKVHLLAKYENGKQVLGEHDIDEPDQKQGKYRIVELEIVPKAQVNPNAIKAIAKADLIVLGPGDFYTSILPNLVIDGVSEAIGQSKAKTVFVLNLMTRFGQTVGFEASDFLEELKDYMQGGKLDYCLVNSSDEFPRGVLARYKREKAQPVGDDLGKVYGEAKIVRRDLISNKVYEKTKSDGMIRSLIRHDYAKLAKAIYGLLS